LWPLSSQNTAEITEDCVKAHCRGVLASFKIPQQVYFFETIPRTLTGKVQKHLLAEQIATSTTDRDLPRPVPTGSPRPLSVSEAVEQVVADYMGTISSEAVRPDQPLFEAGLDSLGSIELIALFEKRFQMSVSPTLLYDYPTLAALKTYFEANGATLGNAIENLDAPTDDETSQPKLGRREGAALTVATVVLQPLGLFIRPALLALSIMPVLVLLDACSRWLNGYELLLTGPLWLALFLANTMGIVLLIKLALGRPTAKTCDLWSVQYFRWLFLHNLFRSLEVPLGVLRGTALLNSFYRLCGAKIGQQVFLDTVTIQDPELITIGDNTIIGRDVNIQPNDIRDGKLVREPICIEPDCIIGENASLLGGAHVRRGTRLSALAVVGGSKQSVTADTRSDIGRVPGHQVFGALGPMRISAGYLIVGYLTSAAIALGIVFVRALVEIGGAALPSISALALGISPPTMVPLSFFVAAALAIYLVIPAVYFALVASCKRLALTNLNSRNTGSLWVLWSHWLYAKLIDVPFFRMYLRLTVGSHLTKWNFQLLGAQIGARPFLAAPYTAEPELLEMADCAMLAGNVSAYALDRTTGSAEKVRIGNSAVVANSCVLHGGANLAQSSLLGDLSAAGSADAIPQGAIAVGVPPKIVGRTDFRYDQIDSWCYFRNQFLLAVLQIVVLTTINVAGFGVMGLLANAFVLPAPFFVVWLAAPGLLLVPRLIKVMSVPISKWLVLGRVSPGEHPAYSWYYTRWQLIETILWDAEEAILSQFHGMQLLNVLWRILGARVGAGACVFSSSLACEYDLKEIGDGVVLQHNSLVFCHSIEHHSWLFRPTVIQDNAEIGPFAIVEAGAVVKSARRISPHMAVHAIHARRGSGVVPDAIVLSYPHLAESSVGAGEVPSMRAVSRADSDLRNRFQCLHEFVKAAHEKLDRSSWDYLIGGSETETTYARNRLALDCLGLRPRVLRDVSKIDCSTMLFGKPLRIPVLCAPVGALETFDPGGAASVAQAAKQFGNGIIVSSVSQPGLQRTAAAAGRAFKIFQLYVRGDEAWVDHRIRRAVASGYDAFCLTVDTDLYSRRERDLAGRHHRRRVRTDQESYQARFSWTDIARIKAKCDIPLIIKGVATAEDAEIALDHGVEGIYVSNHGGRQLDHGLGSIAVLPEIVEAVAGRAKIIIDGAITRGTDVVKAIALGADAVAVGRLYVYALAAAGTPGVIRLFEILEDEVRICLGLLGLTHCAELTSSYLREAPSVVTADLQSAFPHLDLRQETRSRGSGRSDLSDA
jgi:non-ribosomal peptide synthetase-like protein